MTTSDANAPGRPSTTRSRPAGTSDRRATIPGSPAGRWSPAPRSTAEARSRVRRRPGGRRGRRAGRPRAAAQGARKPASLATIDENGRRAFLEGAAEEWQRANGRAPTEEELRRILARYPGDLMAGRESARSRRGSPGRRQFEGTLRRRSQVLVVTHSRQVGRAAYDGKRRGRGLGQRRGAGDDGSPPATTRGFLFADLRDYTRYVETHGDEAAARS